MKKIIFSIIFVITLSISFSTAVSSENHRVFAANEIEVLGFKDVSETSGTVRYKINTATLKTYAVVVAVSAVPQLTKEICDVPFSGEYQAGETYFRTFSGLSPGNDMYVRVCAIDANGNFYVSSGNDYFTTLGSRFPAPDGTIENPPSNSPGRSIKLENPLGKSGIDNIPDLIKAILEIALKIGVPLIALAIIYAGFKFIAAQGNPEKLKEAKQTLIYVVIGAAILLAAYAIATAIVNTVQSVTG